MDDACPPKRQCGPEPLLASSCEVLLDGMEVMADIGALASERGVPQPLRVHVAVEVVPPLEDELAQTFDYTKMHAFVLELAGERIALVETFAQRLARMCMAHDIVLAVEVRIEKPRAVPGCIAGTRVRLGRSRHRPWASDAGLLRRPADQEPLGRT